MPRAAAKPELDPLSAVVDEAAELERELAPLKGKINRLEGLKKLIRATAANWKPDKEGRVRGTRFDAILGPRGFEKHVNASKLYQLVTPRAFVPLCAVTLKNLHEAKIAPAVQAQVITEAQTGSRSLDFVERKAA